MLENGLNVQFHNRKHGGLAGERHCSNSVLGVVSFCIHDFALNVSQVGIIKGPSTPLIGAGLGPPLLMIFSMFLLTEPVML